MRIHSVILWRPIHWEPICWVHLNPWMGWSNEDYVNCRNTDLKWRYDRRSGNCNLSNVMLDAKIPINSQYLQPYWPLQQTSEHTKPQSHKDTYAQTTDVHGELSSNGELNNSERTSLTFRKPPFSRKVDILFLTKFSKTSWKTPKDGEKEG